MDRHIDLLRSIDVDHDLLNQRARDAFLQGHRTGVTVPRIGKVLTEPTQRQFVVWCQRSSGVIQIVEFLRDASLFFQLAVPTLLEDLSHKTIAGFHLIVLRKRTLDLVAHLLQLPLECGSLVAAFFTYVCDGHETRVDALRRDHLQDDLT